MTQNNAFTGIELEAARRREVIRESIVDARVESVRRAPEQRTGKRDLAWLAASATLALGSRLVRG